MSPSAADDRIGWRLWLGAVAAALAAHAALVPWARVEGGGAGGGGGGSIGFVDAPVGGAAPAIAAVPVTARLAPAPASPVAAPLADVAAPLRPALQRTAPSPRAFLDAPPLMASEGPTAAPTPPEPAEPATPTAPTGPAAMRDATAEKAALASQSLGDAVAPPTAETSVAATVPTPRPSRAASVPRRPAAAAASADAARSQNAEGRGAALPSEAGAGSPDRDAGGTGGDGPGGGGAGTGKAEGGGDGADALAAYAREVRRALARAKRYPASALARGLEGEGRLALSIRSDGSLAHVGVAASTGVDALDRELLDMAGRAAPFPRPPAGLAGGEARLILPVAFRLR